MGGPSLLGYQHCGGCVNRSCVVSFRDSRGDEWSHVTAASTVFKAVRAAQAWFSDPFWKGPRPTLDTVFKVALVGDDRTWRARAMAVRTPETRNPQAPPGT
jgi:hypothetical protein